MMVKFRYFLRGTNLYSELSWGYSETNDLGRKSYRNIRLATDIRCDPQDVCPKTKKPLNGTLGKSLLFEEKVNHVFRGLQLTRQIVSPEVFKAELNSMFGKSEQSVEVHDIAQFIREKMTSGKADSTQRDYRALANKVDVYSKEHNLKLNNITMNQELYNNFLSFWASHTVVKDKNGIHKSVHKPRRQNSVWSNKKRLKATLLAMRTNSPDIFDPRAVRSTSHSYVQENYATVNLDQIRALSEFDPKTSCLQNALVSFMCLALTGSRHSDLHKIVPGITEVEGIVCTRYFQTKRTNKSMPTEVCIPLFKPILDLVDMHGPPRQISNQKLNAALKNLFQEAGLTEETVLTITGANGKRISSTRPLCEIISTHMGRRSFVSNFSFVPLPMLAKLTGHGISKSSEFGVLLGYDQTGIERNAVQFANLIKANKIVDCLMG